MLVTDSRAIYPNQWSGFWMRHILARYAVRAQEFFTCYELLLPLSQTKAPFTIEGAEVFSLDHVHTMLGQLAQ